MINRKEYLKNIKRIVVKVGTSTLTHSSGLINIRRIEGIVKQLVDVNNMGIDIILVTSGAIGAGMSKLGLKDKPNTIEGKQAAAAVGQGLLIQMYEKFFSEYGKVTAQILLTKGDIEDEIRYINAKNTFLNLLSQNVIPVVNENDAVVVDEIKVGDNDTLSAMVAGLIKADLLIILSDIEGLYDSNPTENPNAELIKNVENITEEIKKYAEDSGTRFGTGGMKTKIKAAEIAASTNCCMVIAKGDKPYVISDIIEGKDIGTLFVSK